AHPKASPTEVRGEGSQEQRALLDDIACRVMQLHARTQLPLTCHAFSQAHLLHVPALRIQLGRQCCDQLLTPRVIAALQVRKSKLVLTLEQPATEYTQDYTDLLAHALAKLDNCEAVEVCKLISIRVYSLTDRIHLHCPPGLVQHLLDSFPSLTALSIQGPCVSRDALASLLSHPPLALQLQQLDLANICFFKGMSLEQWAPCLRSPTVTAMVKRRRRINSSIEAPSATPGPLSGTSLPDLTLALQGDIVRRAFQLGAGGALSLTCREFSKTNLLHAPALHIQLDIQGCDQLLTPRVVEVLQARTCKLALTLKQQPTQSNRQYIRLLTEVLKKLAKCAAVDACKLAAMRGPSLGTPKRLGCSHDLAEHLMRCFPGLTSLSLHNYSIPCSGLASLLAHPRLSLQLQQLDLTGATITQPGRPQPGAATLDDLFHASRLKQLSLSTKKMAGEDKPLLPNLQPLSQHLTQLCIQQQGYRECLNDFTAPLAPLAQLQVLTISLATDLGGLSGLLHALPQLHTLQLPDARVYGQEQLDALLAATQLTSIQLKELTSSCADVPCSWQRLELTGFVDCASAAHLPLQSLTQPLQLGRLLIRTDQGDHCDLVAAAVHNLTQACSVPVRIKALQLGMYMSEVDAAAQQHVDLQQLVAVLQALNHCSWEMVEVSRMNVGEADVATLAPLCQGCTKLEFCWGSVTPSLEFWHQLVQLMPTVTNVVFKWVDGSTSSTMHQSLQLMAEQPWARWLDICISLPFRSRELPTCWQASPLTQPGKLRLHLQHLAAASSAGTSLEANQQHITVTLATWDVVWEAYLDLKWARQRLRLELLFQKLEEEVTEASMERHKRVKQLVVFFGMSGIGSRGGWGADAVLQACCKVVCRPRGTDQRWGRVALANEFRTSWVSSAANNQQEHGASSVTSQCGALSPMQPGSLTARSQSQGQSTPPPAKRSKRTQAEQAAEPTQPTKGHSRGKGKAAKSNQAPHPGRWLDRVCNATLNMQLIGESRWRSLEPCWWPDQADQICSLSWGAAVAGSWACLSCCERCPSSTPCSRPYTPALLMRCLGCNTTHSLLDDIACRVMQLGARSLLPLTCRAFSQAHLLHIPALRVELGRQCCDQLLTPQVVAVLQARTSKLTLTLWQPETEDSKCYRKQLAPTLQLPQTEYTQDYTDLLAHALAKLDSCAAVEVCKLVSIGTYNSHNCRHLHCSPGLAQHLLDSFPSLTALTLEGLCVSSDALASLLSYPPLALQLQQLHIANIISQDGDEHRLLGPVFQELSMGHLSTHLGYFRECLQPLAQLQVLTISHVRRMEGLTEVHLGGPEGLTQLLQALPQLHTLQLPSTSIKGQQQLDTLLAATQLTSVQLATVMELGTSRADVPCSWQRLKLTGWVYLKELAYLPLHSLSQPLVLGTLSISVEDTLDPEMAAAIHLLANACKVPVQIQGVLLMVRSLKHREGIWSSLCIRLGVITQALQQQRVDLQQQRVDLAQLVAWLHPLQCCGEVEVHGLHEVTAADVLALAPLCRDCTHFQLYGGSVEPSLEFWRQLVQLMPAVQEVEFDNEGGCVSAAMHESLQLMAEQPWARWLDITTCYRITASEPPACWQAGSWVKSGVFK
ncbi:hypothetical protein QJQ45_021759, partial [Haematococcus lacustris]